MKTAGIETRPVFYPAHTMPHCRIKETFRVAESLSSRGINLPSFPSLTKEQVSLICKVIRDFLIEAEIKKGGENE